MPLINVALAPSTDPLPSLIRELILEANQRVNQFMSDRPKPLVGFFPSCFESAYRSLKQIADERLMAGNTFCEWGSGFGVVACMASLLGFDAYGIEIDGELADVSRQLASQFDIPAKFTTGSFIPEGSDRIIDRAYADIEGDMMLNPHSDNTYHSMGLDVSDFDLIFAYPWPKDAKVTSKIFEKFASNEALLLTYNGRESMKLKRKRITSNRIIR